MARNKSARRRARGSRECSISVHAVRTVDEAITALYGPGPESDDWRDDVLGYKDLSVRLSLNGGLTINGHPLTPEVCEALQQERPDEAHDFDHGKFVQMGRRMIPGLEMRRPAPR